MNINEYFIDKTFERLKKIPYFECLDEETLREILLENTDTCSNFKQLKNDIERRLSDATHEISIFEDYNELGDYLEDLNLELDEIYTYYRYIISGIEFDDNFKEIFRRIKYGHGY